MENAKIPSRSKVKLGIVPTHFKFVGGLIPDQNQWNRNSDGKLELLDRLEKLADASPTQIQAVQIPHFTGIRHQDVVELVAGIRQLGCEPTLILMVGGDPLDPNSESAFVEHLLEALAVAKELQIEHVCSTSFESWMQQAPPRTGAAYDEAVDRLVQLHSRAYQESALASSSVIAWHLEFLRDIEFSTFTNLRRAWDVVRGLNQAIERPFFKVLVDAAHCGDSDLSMDDHCQLIQEIANSDGLGMFHASAKTTRGCLSTDDGWIAALLGTCLATGKLQHVLVELFHHEDEALGMLREMVPGHGIDTRDGRASYDELVCDGLRDVVRRLNNAVARGWA